MSNYDLPIGSNHCPVSDTLDIIGGKWKVLIIHHLQQMPKRFNELRRDLPNITQRMLTLQLKELVRDGVIHRFDYQEVPPKVEYSLTEQGRTLLPMLHAMHDWGESHAWHCLQIRQALVLNQVQGNDNDLTVSDV